MARSKKNHSFKKGGSFLGMGTSSNSQTNQNSISQDLKTGMSSLGSSISNTWNKLSTNVSGWVSGKKNGSYYPTNSQNNNFGQMGGRMVARRKRKSHSKKQNQKRKTRKAGKTRKVRK